MKHHTLHRIVGPFIFLAVLVLGTAVVMWLWNALIPVIFGFAAITFWQALGLMVLSRLLFGGFGHGFRHAHRHWHGRHGCRPSDREHWDHFHQVRDRMKGMSRNERREFIRDHMNRFADEPKEWQAEDENQVPESDS